MRVAPAQSVQLDQFQHLLDHLRLARVLADAEGDVVGDGQVREQGVVLEHHADPAFFRSEGEPRSGNDLVSQLDFAVVDRFETGDGAQGGGFATT